MELNHIFLFIAVVSSLLVLVRARFPGGTYRGWRVAALVVLAIAAVSWVFLRHQAGYIGGSAWFAFLFLPAVGLRKVTELFAQQRYQSARRLATLLQVLHPTAELRQQVQLFRKLELQQNAGSVPLFPSRPARQDRHRRLKNAPAVLLFIVLNILVFLIEVTRSSPSNPDMLHRLGALDPYSVFIDHQYWRLLTALFLHYGAVHLLFNVFALYVLGPSLERTIGTWRFSLCYLLSGLGSTAGVLLLTLLRFIRPAELVGASGCVMGIVGAWAGFLVRHRHTPTAKQRLRNILLIVAIQTAFDLSTPQVSMAAHICGLLTGFLVGLVVAPGPDSSGRE